MHIEYISYPIYYFVACIEDHTKEKAERNTTLF